MTRFILASASPARLQTLRNAGVDPEVIVSGVDEDHVTAPSPGELARTLATLKARAVVSELDGHATVLGCDSVLEIDGVAYGKPGTADEARARLRAMSGGSGVLHTGHCLFDTNTRVELRELASTKVFFATLTEDEIEAYVGTGEPLAVAGSFTVDGLGGAFVEGIEGDHHNVVGISLPLVRRMLAEVGITWTSLWNPSIEYDEAEAERYDDTRGGAERARAAAEAVDRLLEDKGRVLDLAIGTGVVAAELAALGHLVHGVDLSAAMLQHAAIRLPGHVAQADAGVLPIADLRCDAVTAIWLLHLVPDSDALLAEVARILKPGGLFVTTVDKNDSGQVARGNPPNRVRAQDSLAYLASRAPIHGLALESATTFPGPGYVGNPTVPVYPLVAFRRTP